MSAPAGLVLDDRARSSKFLKRIDFSFRRLPLGTEALPSLSDRMEAALVEFLRAVADSQIMEVHLSQCYMSSHVLPGIADALARSTALEILDISVSEGRLRRPRVVFAPEERTDGPAAFVPEEPVHCRAVGRVCRGGRGV